MSQDLVLVETQNWASRSHRELYDAVHVDNDPGRVGELAEEWTKLGREMAESADRMAEKLRDTESGWQGEAADAARAAIRELADWSRDAGDSAGALADRLSEQGRIMEKAKAEMPEPKDTEVLRDRVAVLFSTDNLAAFAQAAVDLRVTEEKASDAHEQAVRVMTRMEQDSRGVDADTPTFTKPPDLIEEIKPPKADRPTPEGHESAPEGDGPASTQQQFAGGGAEATQKLMRPTSAPPGQQASPPAGPAGTGPAGAPLAAQTGQAGANAPTAKMQVPKLTGPSATDAPTVRASPVKPASARSTPKPPSLSDYKSRSTHQGSTQHASGGGDRQAEKTRKMRPVQRPGARRPGADDRDRDGTMPPIPGTSGPRGDVPPIGQTKAAGGSPGAAGGFTPPMPPGGGAAGGAAGGMSGGMTPGGSTGTGGAGEHGGPAQAPAGGQQAPGQPASGGAGGMMGGAGMGNRGQGGQDEERKAKYVEGGPVVEVPGKDLPPPVIGEGKKRKKSEG
ncbi:PPE domain-containing protein [Saccharopolyspora flava]|uniref:PPE-repeat protein n=1 Tax=Saccharopolyspora flava TaxID=95161 RepID=A0A1I6V5D1_9PSEU|nr:PPE domain-containing protein [Saccharopolyspora flava]SFT08958.1 PPE-repeat protein [Saccharopolyspora flava]